MVYSSLASTPMFPILEHRGIVMSSIPRHVADDTCREWHYLGNCMDGDLLYGFWQDSVFHGILAFRNKNQLPSVRKGWAERIGGKCIELSRVALCPQSERHYQTSFYVGMAISYIKSLHKFAACYSYCDPSRHEGILYRACNFIYLYTTKPTIMYVNEDGHEVHSRDSKNKNKRERYFPLGYKPVNAPVKHAYVLPLTRSARKKIKDMVNASATMG